MRSEKEMRFYEWLTTPGMCVMRGIVSSHDGLEAKEGSQSTCRGGGDFKGTIPSLPEQTFNRTWNRCPSIKMNTVTKNDWLIYAAATVIKFT